MVSMVERAQSAPGAGSEATSRLYQQELDKDVFLQLLVTQLKYQDPMDPVQDKEFISQLAQFRSLEETQNLNATISGFVTGQQKMALCTQAMMLLGKTVGIKDQETGEVVTGQVESVTICDGVPEIKVDGKRYSLSDLTEVKT